MKRSQQAQEHETVVSCLLSAPILLLFQLLMQECKCKSLSSLLDFFGERQREESAKTSHRDAALQLGDNSSCIRHL